MVLHGKQEYPPSKSTTVKHNLSNFDDAGARTQSQTSMRRFVLLTLSLMTATNALLHRSPTRPALPTRPPLSARRASMQPDDAALQSDATYDAWARAYGSSFASKKIELRPRDGDPNLRGVVATEARAPISGPKRLCLCCRRQVRWRHIGFLNFRTAKRFDLERSSETILQR